MLARHGPALLLLLTLPAAAAAPEVVDRVLGAALSGPGSYDIVRGLTDRVGARLAGSPGDARAVRWAQEELRRAGLPVVRAEPVRVPRWERGPVGGERLHVLAPVEQPLAVVALGGSVPTPPAGLAAEVVELRSFDELAALPRERVAGRMVLWNVTMDRGMGGYGAVARYRTEGAIHAARKGAVASLVRSLGMASYRLPHTGALRYEERVPRIPAAAVSAEDADLIHRLLESGPVRLRLQLPCRALPEAVSHNVIGEIPGQSDEIVLLGAHLDSWDLGTGAVDDGAGVAIVVGAARAILRGLGGARPRRTLRVVLFANEENGLRGAKAYAQVHGAELRRHVVAIEADSGAGRPLGFGVPTEAAARLLEPLAAPLLSLGAAGVKVLDVGAPADLSPMKAEVPIVLLLQDTARYFEWHHTAADTLDKIDPLELGLATAALAVVTYGLLESSAALPRPAAQP